MYIFNTIVEKYIFILKGAVSHALDPSVENIALPVILLIAGRKIKYKGLQQETQPLVSVKISCYSVILQSGQVVGIHNNNVTVLELRYVDRHLRERQANFVFNIHKDENYT